MKNLLVATLLIVGNFAFADSVTVISCNAHHDKFSVTVDLYPDDTHPDYQLQIVETPNPNSADGSSAVYHDFDSTNKLIETRSRATFRAPRVHLVVSKRGVNGHLIGRLHATDENGRRMTETLKCEIEFGADGNTVLDSSGI